MYWLTQWLAFHYDHKPNVGSLLFSCCCGLTAFFFWLFVTCIFCILFFFLFWWFITVHWSSFKKRSICICAGADDFMMKPKSGGVIQTIASRSRPHSTRVWPSTMTILPRALALTVKTSSLGTRRRSGTCECCNIHDFQGIGSREETQTLQKYAFRESVLKGKPP